MKKIYSLIALNVVFCFVLQAQSRRPYFKKLTEYGIAYNVSTSAAIPQSSKAYVMNFDGSNSHPLLADQASSWVGGQTKQRLFLVSNREACPQCYFLYSCTYAGDSLQKLSTLQLEGPEISCRKGGKEILVVGRIGEAVRHQLFVVDVRSGSYKQLTKDTGALYASPCYSPDGKRIAYLSRKNKSNSSALELFVMSENGAGNRALTRASSSATHGKELLQVTGGVKWHPKENFVSFVASQDGKQSIFAVNPNSSRQWKLTDNAYAEGSHDWSSDGKWLVLTSYEARSTQSHITLMHWKNKDQRQVTEAKFKIQKAPLFFEK